MQNTLVATKTLDHGQKDERKKEAQVRAMSVCPAVGLTRCLP